MEFLTKTETFMPYENMPELISHLEVYRFSEDEVDNIREQAMPPEMIMERFGFAVPAYQVEAGEMYIDRNFVAYDPLTGLLVIEVRKSLNV